MDVEEGSLVETLNTFTKLEPLKALIFANSAWGDNLTFRGMVEFRGVCEQPVKEIMASTALHAGLMSLYQRAENLLSPAREMAEGLLSGRRVDDYIEEYGRL